MAERRGSRRSTKAARRARRRPLGRLLPLVVLAVVAYFYYRPIASWMHTRAALRQREAQVAVLTREKNALARDVSRATSLPSLERRARRIGLVRPGEQLFIVKGIPAWKRAHSRKR